MRQAVLICLLSFVADALSADERSSFQGVWGTAAQCAGEPIQPGGSVLATPYEIDAEWLKQGAVWCQLSWFPIERRQAGLFTGALARCGEDAVRSYLLGLTLSEGDLTVTWDVFRSSGPMRRCAAAG